MSAFASLGQTRRVFTEYFRSDTTGVWRVSARVERFAMHRPVDERRPLPERPVAPARSSLRSRSVFRPRWTRYPALVYVRWWSLLLAFLLGMLVDWYFFT